MKKVNEWTCGNVSVSASLEVPDETPAGIATLAIEGLTQILQRKPSSSWEKAEAGYEKRPAGFSRDSIAFTPESAAKLVKGFEAALPKGVVVSFATSEHVKGEEVGTSKEAEKLWTEVQAKPPEKFEQNLKVLGLDEDYDDAKGIAACHKFLLEAKRKAAAAAKAEKDAALS